MTEPVGVSPAVPVQVTPFTMTSTTTQKEVTENLNFSIIQWMSETDVPPHSIKCSSFLNMIKEDKQVSDVYKVSERNSFSCVS